MGLAAQRRVPHESHAILDPASARNPLALLGAQEADRLAFLLPLRHARMAESAFSFYRGSAAVMASDLASTPRTGIIVQAAGDAHLSNFGLFASPERTLVFDANDFDETHPGPWEWDVKRLAASVVIAGRANGFGASHTRAAAKGAAHGYRHWMGRYSEMPLLDVWYTRITAAELETAVNEALKTGKLPRRIRAAGLAKAEALFSKARGRDELRAFDKLTAVVNGKRVLADDPPVIQHIEVVGGSAPIAKAFQAYQETLSEDRQALIGRYRMVDYALKVVGVGSVGTRCFVLVLEGDTDADPLIIQAKEATASVLEPYVEHSRYANHGERVVTGQRLMQSTPDIFLGWTRGPEGRDFYIRQLWDMKGSVDTSTLEPPGLAFYAGICGWSLARTHARSGGAVAIAAYLDKGDTFDSAIADFAEAYADLNERDHRAYATAIDNARPVGSDGPAGAT